MAAVATQNINKVLSGQTPPRIAKKYKATANSNQQRSAEE
jgi:hypothetical protein